MTREEAIQALNEIFDDSEFSRYEAWYGGAMDMAIEALSADAPSGDLISRQAAIEAIENHDTDQGFIGCILDLPSADREDYEKGYKDGQLAVMTGNDEKEFERGYRMGQAADRPKGEWIEVTNGRGGHECSECHSYAPSYASGDEHLSDFCPHCGAKMLTKESTENLNLKADGNGVSKGGGTNER